MLHNNEEKRGHTPKELTGGLKILITQNNIKTIS